MCGKEPSKRKIFFFYYFSFIFVCKIRQLIVTYMHTHILVHFALCALERTHTQQPMDNGIVLLHIREKRRRDAKCVCAFFSLSAFFLSLCLAAAVVLCALTFTLFILHLFYSIEVVFFFLVAVVVVFHFFLSSFSLFIFIHFQIFTLCNSLLANIWLFICNAVGYLWCSFYFLWTKPNKLNDENIMVNRNKNKRKPALVAFIQRRHNNNKRRTKQWTTHNGKNIINRQEEETTLLHT